MTKLEKNNIKVVNKNGPAGGFYFLTFVGTLVYFLNKADGVGEILLAFLQAMVWPALLLHRVFQMLQI